MDLSPISRGWLGVAIAAGAAFIAPGLGAEWLAGVERAGSRFARRRGLAVLTVASLALAGRMLLLPSHPIPYPAIHDESSYLLAADTFASGRVANPTHPMWIHFETFHVNQQPTYGSMYPPAQGLFLALGQVLMGRPWFGVWLSAGIMCGAICWMLRGWLPPGWALLGGLIAVMRFGLFSYWINSYYGGAVAATGGALVLGALPRIMRRPRAGQAVILGIGVLVLANSRPFEGMVLALAVAAIFLSWMVGIDAPPLGVLLVRFVLPVALVLVMGAGAMGYYFRRTTGNPLLMPYQVNLRHYAPFALFFWQSDGPHLRYNHWVMDKFYNDRVRRWHAHTAGAIARKISERFIKLASFFLGSPLALGLLGFPWILKNRRIRPLLIVAAAGAAGMASTVWSGPHYAAPFTAIFLAAALESMRHLRLWRPRGRPCGLTLARAVPLLCGVMLFTCAIAGSNEDDFLCWLGRGNVKRANLEKQLESLPERHLVITRYRRDHRPGTEWVYNRADIDAAKVVWAREMDTARNAELIAYFHDRKVWLLEPDENPVLLSPYTGPPGP